MVFEHSAGARALATAACVVAVATMLPSAAQATPVAPEEVSSEPAVMGVMSLIPWHTSPSLVALRREIDNRWPNRSRISDGVIGDNRHSVTRNSHNPVGASNGPRYGTRGAVHAMDITAAGIDVQRVLNGVIGDSRVWYVIHAGKIWSRTYGWAARTQYGDPHNSHIHINLREDSQSAATAAERNTSSWLSGTSPAYSTSPSPAPSLTTSQVKDLQRALIKRGFAIPAGPTGFYGAQTTSAVAAFQRSQGWRGSEADGIVGPETLKRLGLSSGSAPKKTVSTAPVKVSAPKSTSTKVTPPSSNPLTKKKTKKLQKALIKRGFAIPAGPTGIYGAQTTRAVAAFQRSQGWRGSDADGIAGPTTLQRLGVKAPTKSTPAASKKPAKVTKTSKKTKWDPNKASLVQQLQGALISRGYSIPAGRTGYFGPVTKKAVKAYQRSQGWRGSDADGVPGSETLRRLGL